jgi:hypothetical protein
LTTAGVKAQQDCYCWPGDVLELQKGVVLGVTQHFIFMQVE